MEIWKKELIEYFNNKKINILGFGREGKSIYKFLRQNYPELVIYISDKNDITEDDIFKTDDINKIIFNCGETYLDDLEKFDLIIKSPGISMKDVDFSNNIELKNKIVSQIDLFLKFFDGLTIGVTGTKGKSTTSSLINEVLIKNDKKSVLMGNIGIPVFDNIDYISNDMIAVIELSSHALEFMHESTDIAVIINIFPEHLDHYNSAVDYAKAKLNLFVNQKNKNKEISNIKLCEELTELMVKTDYDFEKNNVIFTNNDMLEIPNLIIPGEHNRNNANLVKHISNILKLDELKTNEALAQFKGLEHRLEFVKEVNNVKYYNDSISTIPETTINGVKALKNVKILILGGNDRGIDLSKLLNFLNSDNENLKSLKNIILLPKTGHDIYDKLDNKRYNLIKVENVKEAVKFANDITESGICLLSPAASSYGFYINFEDRGRQYKESIFNLK